MRPQPGDRETNVVGATLTRFLETTGVGFHQLPNQPVFEFSIQMQHGRFTCHALALDEENEFIFYCLCSVRVPVERRMAMAELITRVNNSLRIGGFEMDYDTGEVRYKTSIDVTGSGLTPALVQHAVAVNVSTMDHFVPRIMSVAYAGKSPVEVLKHSGDKAFAQSALQPDANFGLN